MTSEELEIIKHKMTHRNMVDWYETMEKLIGALEEAWGEIDCQACTIRSMEDHYLSHEGQHFPDSVYFEGK